MKYIILYILLVILTGCATPSAAVSEGFAITYDQYTICRRAYAHANVRWIEINAGRHDISSVQMKREMRLNKCRIKRGDIYT